MRNPTRCLLVAAVGALALFATGCAPIHPSHPYATRGAHADSYRDSVRDPYLHHWHRTSQTHHLRHRFLLRHGGGIHKGHHGHHRGCHR